MPDTALWVQNRLPYGSLNPQIASDLQEEYQALNVFPHIHICQSFSLTGKRRK